MAISPWTNPDTGAVFNYGANKKMTPNDAAGLGSMAGGALYGLFGNPKNPMEGAQKYFEQVPGQLHPYYDPYVESGRQALPTLQNQFQSLLSNPSALMSQIGGGYQQSPGYQWQMDQAMQAANNAAAAGGMVGSPQHQQQAATVASGLANQDYYNYIDRAMRNYMTGLEGEQGLNTQGFNASSDLAQMLAQALMSQGQLEYENIASQNKANAAESEGIGGFLGGLGSLVGLF